MNYQLFQSINNWAGHFPALDMVMIGITNLVPYIAIALILLLWFSGKHETLIKKQYTALYAVFSSVLALSINALIHLVYYHPRPFVVHHVHQLVHHTVDSSFVSDHAVLVFAIGWTLLLRNDGWKYPALMWAVLVSISRIYVGVHYPADVIGSAVISYGTSLFVLSVSKRLEPIAQSVFRLFYIATKNIPVLSRYSSESLSKKK